jgi:hypothetical protein
MREVGSLPPDANRLSDNSYPKGDAGLYAPSLPLKTEVRNDSDNGTPLFRLSPLAVGIGQTVEVQVIMLPKVWFKEVEVDRDKLADFAKGAFMLLTASSFSGLITLGVGAILGGVFGGGPDKVLAPCMQTVITASHLFSHADLEAIRAEGSRRFGPADNDLSPICGLIDSFYWLSVGTYTDWPSFGPPPPAKSGSCELRPHAHFPKKSFWLEGSWSDTGDTITACIVCTVVIDGNDQATVHLTLGHPGPGNPVRTFEDRDIDLAIPDPPFARNVYDDACPARSVVPTCPDCEQFTNLPLSLRATKEFLAMAALAPRHHGAPRLIRPEARGPLVHETLPLVQQMRPAHSEETMKAAKPAAFAGSSPAKSSQHSEVTRPLARAAPSERITPSLSATNLPDGRVEITPIGTPPLHLFDEVNPVSRYKYDERHDFVAVVGSFRIMLNEQETLYSYGEFHSGKPCCARLRYVKTDGEGHVLADILMMGLGPIVK